MSVNVLFLERAIRRESFILTPEQKYICRIIYRAEGIIIPALFVSLKAPYERLKIGGIEVRLRNFGKQLGLSKVHPHKFRRTLATMAIDKGMPIEQLQQLLGHRKIDTTLQYAMVKQSNVKLAHRKYIG